MISNTTKMFWQNLLLLFLGILATVGDTAPFTPFGNDTAVTRIGTLPLSKRYEDPSVDFTVFRADTYVHP
jgi:hypothetical protein